MNKNDLSNHIAGLLAAGLAFAAAWLARPLAIFAPGLIAVVPVMLSFVCAYSGPIWAAAGALSAVAGAWLGCGAVYGCSAFIGLALPAAVQYFTYVRRIDFRRAVCINVGAFLALGVCALGLLRLWAGDLAELQASYVRSLWDSQVSFDLLGGGIQKSRDMRRALLAALGARGYMSPKLFNELLTSPSSEVYGRCIDYAVYNIRSVANYTITGTLAAASLAGGVVMTAWPRMISVRRADTPAMPFVPLRDWFLPADTALYACGMYLVSALIVPFMPEWWYSVDYSIKQLTAVLMCMQGVAAMERQLRRGGMKRGTRGLLIFFAAASFRSMVTLIGVISALMGSHGAISTWIKKKMEEDGEE